MVLLFYFWSFSELSLYEKELHCGSLAYFFSRWHCLLESQNERHAGNLMHFILYLTEILLYFEFIFIFLLKCTFSYNFIFIRFFCQYNFTKY